LNRSLNKCKIFIILKYKKDILKYESLHYNYLEKNSMYLQLITKHKIINEIKRNSTLFDIRPKCLYNEISWKIKPLFPEYKYN